MVTNCYLIMKWPRMVDTLRWWKISVKKKKNLKKETVYQVGVRMEDGSRRTLEVAQPPAVGSKVTVDGSSLRSNNGGVYNAPAPVLQRTSQQAPVYSAPVY